MSRFFSSFDLHLLGQGTHYRAYERLGAHVITHEGVRGTRFAVWAPNARRVWVIGDWNYWTRGADPLSPEGESGIWTGFAPHAQHGACYKYAIEAQDGRILEKFDPYAFAGEMRPRTASRVWELEGHAWGDGEWMRERRRRNALDAPISVYEVHLGSWMRVPEEGNRWLTYREAGPKLAAYCRDMGYTHVELLPLTEHPFDGSWGYQTIGYYAPTARFGTPQDFMAFVDTLHQAGVGVLMDWVPAHFPKDEHGLARFDGTCLYEHEDPRQGEHPHWGTLVFNFARREVANFLIGNALFWLDRYHLDGLRVDAVASMLYLDYGRSAGEWVPNAYGGHENLDAVAFLRRLNEQVYLEHPDCMTVAEESTSWPGVSRPTWLGGLGFGLKWNMGFMHDTLRYFSKDPVHRRWHHNDLTFGLLYAWTENFMLAYSHDEVVHLKKSLLDKMPGDPWQRFANMRLLLGFMFGHPGKKLLFMGAEIGQWDEWSHERSLDWHLLEHAPHRGLRQWMRDLNHLYRHERALHEVDFESGGFEWIDCSDGENGVLAWLRRGRAGAREVLVVVNCTPVVRHGYRVGVPRAGFWEELVNGDAWPYGGSGVGNEGGRWSEPVWWHGRADSLAITLPPLAALFLAPR